MRVHGSADHADAHADRDDADADADAFNDADTDADADDTHAAADQDNAHADPHEDTPAPAPGADWPRAQAGACSYTRRQHLPGDWLRPAPQQEARTASCAGLLKVVRPQAEAGAPVGAGSTI